MTAQPALSDQDLMILCGYEEALGETDDGIAAVYQVIRNRMAAHYQSDGTVAGTILRHAQFSWVEFAFVHNTYQQVAFTPDAVQGRLHTLLAAAQKDHAGWQRCAHILEMVTSGRYPMSSGLRAVRAAVLYANLAILPHHPDWATPAKFVGKVDQQSFYRA